MPRMKVVNGEYIELTAEEEAELDMDAELEEPGFEQYTSCKTTD